MIINQIPFFGLALALFFFDLANSSIFEKAHKQQCQPIHIDSCLDLPYNSTIAPKSNIFGDEQSLSEQVRHFNPLFKTKCSSHLKFLVCSVFAPMCPPEMPQAVTSCRSVCEEVKRDCMSILSEFDIKWPSLLNCTNFPLEPELCMKPAAAPARVTTHSTRSPIFNSRPRQNHINPIPHQLPSCPADLLNLDPTDANSKCALPCNRHFLFSQ
uniref:FZ domain-containing protein n=3 Tax=Bursaphelenchus xylophilus TaxID=6326 RepID=A0A1I7SGE6_BURXY